MLKKTLCLLLAALMLMSTVACASVNTDTPADGQTTAPTADSGEETELTLDLPEKDYSETPFRILGLQTAVDHVLAEKTEGEEVNDALVTANMYVSGMFNVKFESILIEDELNANIIRAFIMSGNDEYDVAYLHDCNSASMALNGWFLNVNELPYLDPTAPWWPQFTVESLTYNGKLYHYSNYTSYQSMEWTWGCFFNQKILDDYNQPTPYASVRDGSWTLDKINAMSSNIYSDLNGDSRATTEDLLGFAFTQTPYGWLESFGIEMYKKESADSAALSLATEDELCYTLIDELHEWFYSGSNAVHVNFHEGGTVGNSMFTEGRLAFTFERIGKLAPLAMDADIAYGIVPLPKINEAQPGYKAGCHDRLFSVPTTVRDQERVGIILEAMAYAGHKFILPAYCETTLKTRLATDPDCEEMLNMIFAQQVISFAYLFDRQENGNGLQLNLIIKTVERKNVASFFKGQKRVAQRVIESIMDFYA